MIYPQYEVVYVDDCLHRVMVKDRCTSDYLGADEWHSFKEMEKADCG
jgi:hypothetical protein